MRLIMVKGFSKTGKTTTVEALAAELCSRGYTVGTVKDIHYEGFQTDVPGTDTFKHAHAGARRVTARGQNETAIFTNRQMTIHEILKYYKEDFVILEGDCGIKCPTIITGRTAGDIEKRMCPEAIAVSGVIAGSDAAEVTPEARFCMGLPLIDVLTQVKALADLVERKTEKMKNDLDVELTIGGEEIWMVPFVKETIKNVVIGAVKALDGYEEDKEIIIKIK